MPLGDHGIYTRSTLDHLTMQRIDRLKSLAEEMTGKPFASGCIIRAAVAFLTEESERWQYMEPQNLTPVKTKLLAAKKARAAEFEETEEQRTARLARVPRIGSRS